ncbi:MAG: aspartate aminotransferase family protein [Chitinophagaceae bacterium]|jgi:acetylornithine/succinyldiaminopimelate/putrescine aminotransferase
MATLNNRQLFFQHLAQTSPVPIGIEVASSKGIHITDVAGKSYVDMISGFSVCNIGHSHPAVIAAIKEQIEKYMHVIVYGEFIQSPQVQYAQLLTQSLPPYLQSVYFTNSGAEATEGAMKLAKRITKRSKIVSFKGAYHGSTQGALSIMGDEYFKNAFRPLLPDTIQLKYNDLTDIHLIDESVACVFVELVQAETGVTPAQKDWLQALQKKCKEHCILFIVDEIQSGFGRTGTLFAFEQYDIQPDILLVGKALGGGLPLGAFITDPRMMATLTYSPVLGHITTFGGNPVSCAAGKAAFEVLQKENWIQEVAAKEVILLQHMNHPLILNRQHKGLWMSLQFESVDLTKKIAAQCVLNGVITDWFLFSEDRIRIAPPLCISETELIDAIERIKLSIDQVVSS